jgi:hypothetical protein
LALVAWEGFRDYVRFNRALVDAATAGIGKKTAEEIAAELRPKFPVFTKEQLLTDMEYGGTPWSQAVINVKGRRSKSCGSADGQFLPLPELYLHTALGAADHADDGDLMTAIYFTWSPPVMRSI